VQAVDARERSAEQQQQQQRQLQQQAHAPSRKPRARASKREVMREGRGSSVIEVKKHEAMVELPTITSQETSRRNHEEELAMQRTLRAKLLKSTTCQSATERDERDKAQLARYAINSPSLRSLPAACHTHTHTTHTHTHTRAHTHTGKN
jgi:hypothetical protein